MEKTRTSARPARKSAGPRPADTCRLTLHIRGTPFAVKPIPSPDGRAYRIRNTENRKLYDVAETEHGPSCDCGDFVFRHHGIDAVGCKHVRALRAFGMLG